MTSVDDLMQPITVVHAKASIYQVLEQLGVPTTSWKPGAVVRAVVYLVAFFVAAVSSVITSIAKMGYQSTATGEWATVNAQEVYGITRTGATFAKGTVSLTNSLGGVYSMAIGQLIVEHFTTKKTYKNIAAFSLGAGGTVDVDVEAVESGSNSNAAVGTITVLVTPMIGVTCTNALPLAGIDQQSDEDLYIETQEAMDSNSPNGPLNVYGYVLRGRGGKDAAVAAIGVNRVQTLHNINPGGVKCFVATASGGVTSGDLTVLLDSVVRWAMPLGVNVSVVSAALAANVAIKINAAVYYYQLPGLSDVIIKARCEAAILAYMRAQPIGGNPRRSDDAGYGGRLYIDAIRGVCQGGAEYATDPAVSTTGLGIYSAEIVLTSPSGVPIGDNQGIEVDPGHVAIPGVITVTPYGTAPTWQ